MIDLRDKTEAGRMPQEPSGVYLTDMRPSDVADVTALERRCYTLPWSPNAYVTEIGNPSAHYVIARRNDTHEVIGYGGIWVVMDEVHITTLAVDPIMRGRKIGERLLIELMFEGVKRGALRATLEVRQNNHIAHNLYLKFEFHDVAIRRSYYSDNGENAIIMWAEGVATPRYLRALALRKRELAQEDAGGENRKGGNRS